MLKSLGGSIIPLLIAMVVSVLCIYIRSIYRTIELLQGWSGYLITHQSYFVALDGAMMVIAVGVFNFVHPGWFLPVNYEEEDALQREGEGGRGSSFANGVEMIHTLQP